MAASRRQRRKRKTDTYTVAEGGKRLKIGRTRPMPRPSPASRTALLEGPSKRVVDWAGRRDSNERSQAHLDVRR
jgi:hypothetical protein